MPDLQPSPSDAASSPVSWLVPTLSIAAFINTTSAVALGPFLPTIAEELRVSVSLLGQIPSLMLLLAAVLGLIIGPLADQYGYRRTLVVGLVTVAISTLGTGLASSFWPLLLVGLIGSVGRAAVMPTSQALVGHQHHDEDRRRRAISWVGTGHTNAVLLGLPLLTTIAAFTQWRVAFLVLGGMAIVAALLLWWMLPVDRTVPGSAPDLRGFWTAYAPLWRHRPSLGLIGQGFFGNVGSIGTFTYVGAFLVQQRAASPAEVSAAYLAIGIGAVIGVKLVGTRLGSRPRSLMLITRIVGGALIAAALIVPMPLPLTVGVLTIGLSAHVTNSAATAAVLIGESPAGRATTMTLNSAGLSLGGALGGTLGGLLLAVADYSAIGMGALCVLMVATFLVWWSRPEPVTVVAPT